MRYIIKIWFFIILLIPLIVFSEEPNNFPYELNLKKEISLIAGGTLLNLSYIGLKESDYVKVLSESELFNLNSNQINAFDRNATTNWNPDHAEYSDYIRNSLRYLPAAYAIPFLKTKSWDKILTLGFIYAEGYYLTVGATRCTKILVQRKRPYLYNTTTIAENEKLDLLDDENSYFSFFSGHTSSAFYSATFISKAFYDIYGPNEWFYIISTISYSAATTVAYLRVSSGKHYPTDVIIGAVIGTAIGYLVPEFHKKKNSDQNLSLFFPSKNQIGLIYQF